MKEKTMEKMFHENANFDSWNTWIVWFGSVLLGLAVRRFSKYGDLSPKLIIIYETVLNAKTSRDERMDGTMESK